MQDSKTASTAELHTAIILLLFPSNQGTKKEFQNIYSTSDYQTEEFDSSVFLNAKTTRGKSIFQIALPGFLLNINYMYLLLIGNDL